MIPIQRRNESKTCYSKCRTKNIFNVFIFTVSILMIFSCTSLVDQATQTQGTIEAEFSVNQRGSASYRIPIITPPGTNGMQPMVALNYNSSTQNGLLGVGWMLGGLSTISRTGANIRQDGFKGGINYNQNDRFQLDGERLIVIDGSDGQNDAIYRTEKESWKRIVSYTTDDEGNTCGNGPCWFSVTTKEGKQLEYGRTDDSRINAFNGDGDVRVWALNKIMDLNGNYLTISYTSIPYEGAQDEGQYYPSNINYTFNDSTGLQGQRSTEFQYEKRSVVERIYVGGYLVQTSARLSGVITKVGDIFGPRYSISYDTSPATSRSIISEILQCSGDGTSCLPATQFDWQEMTLSFTDDGAWLEQDFVVGWSNNPRFMSDVNGDGLMDIVGFRFDTQVSPAQHDNKFAKASQWNPGFGNNWTDQTPREVADVNGDGLGDVVGFNFGGVEVAPSNGSKFDPTMWSTDPYPFFGRNTTLAWIADRNPRMLTDVTGDGLADIVGFNEKTFVGVSNGTFFETPEVWNDSNFTGTDWWLGKQRVRLLGDVNGDGLADIVGFSNSGVIVGISMGLLGGGFKLEPWNQNAQGFPYFDYDSGWRVGRHPRMLADVNGDGLMDIVGFKDGVQVSLSTGTGFLIPEPWNPGFSIESDPHWAGTYPRMVMDINGDGMADVIGFDLQGAKVALSTGFEFIPGNWNQNSLPEYVGGQADKLLTVGDVNGDGKPDAIAFGTKRGFPFSVSVGLASPKYPDLLTGIVNGVGGKIEITYEPLTDPDVYQKDDDPLGDPNEADGLGFFNTPVSYTYSDIAGSYPIVEVIGGHVYVVKQTVDSMDPNFQATNYNYSTTYDYTNARMDLLSQRWLGFETKSRTTAEDGRKTTEFFNQLYPFNGTVARTEIRCGDQSPDPNCTPDNLLRVEATAYTAVVTATGTENTQPKVYEVLQDTTRSDYYTYSVYNFSIGSTYEYDQYGDPTLISNLGYVNLNGQDKNPDDNLYTCMDYVNVDQDGNWKLGYPQYTKQSKISACDNFSSFDNNDFTLQYRTYDVNGGTMNLLTDQRWDNASSKYLTYSYQYDDYGNRTASTDPQMYTTTTAYDTTYHTFPASTTSPPLSEDNDRTLTNSYNFDVLFGTRTAEINPNGNATITCIDGFGRVEKIQVSSPGGSIVPDQNCMSSGIGSDATVVTVNTYSWNEDDNGIYRKNLELQNWDTGSGRDELFTLEFLDGRSRIYKNVTQANPDSGDIVVCQVFNQYDKSTQEAVPYFNSPNADCSPGGSTPHWSTIEYNVLGMEIKSTRPFGPTGDETVVRITNYPDSETTEQIFAVTSSDPYKRVLQYKYHNNKPRVEHMVVPADDSATTTFTYDQLGRLRSTTDPKTKDNPNGVTDSLMYDSLNRKLKIVTKDRGPTTFDFDSTEWLQSLENNDGKQNFKYDELGRLLIRTLADSSSHHFGYDDSNVSNGLGQKTMASVLDKNSAVVSSYIYGYDKQGNIDSTLLSLGGNSYLTLRNYDPQKRVRQLTYPDNSILERNYSFNNLANLTLADTTYTVFSGYSAFNKPGRISYPQSGVVEEFGYYPTSQFYTHVLKNSEDVKYLDKVVTWDQLQMVSAVADSLKNLGEDTSEEFQYSNLRLTGAQGPYPDQNYEYDQSGNITQFNDILYTYQYHRIKTGTKDNSVLFNAEYDGMGSMTDKVAKTKNWKYGYDKLTQLKSVNLESNEIYTFTYDQDGRRLTKSKPDGNTTSYVSPEYEVVSLSNGDLRITKNLNTDSGARVATVTTANENSQGTANDEPPLGVLYIHRNHIGSTTMTTNSTGEMASAFVYYPYGAIFKTINKDNVRPKFTGKELDASSGLYYFSARYFDPDIGRFITSDNQPGARLARQDALNLYSYVLGSPETLVDPSGHAPPLIAAIAAGVGQAAATVARVAATVGARAAVSAGTRAAVSASTRAAVSTGLRSTASVASRTALRGTRALATTTRAARSTRLSQAVLNIQSRRQMETVFRFATRSNPATLQSNLASSNIFNQVRVRSLLRLRWYREWRAHLHMRGYTRNSPFVSVVRNPSALARSTDPWARSIVTGRPVLQGVRRAPDLGTFRVPSSRLYGPRPDNILSIRETEMLYLGDDLVSFLSRWRTNPF